MCTAQNSARDLFHGYVVKWIEDTRLHLLDLCKTEIMCAEAPAVSPVSPSVENIYEQIREGIMELEVFIKDGLSTWFLLKCAQQVNKSLISTYIYTTYFGQDNMASKLFLLAILGALVCAATARTLSANGENEGKEPARMLFTAGVSIGANAAAPGLAGVDAAVTAGIGHAPPPWLS
ncbi:hypothetical protein FCM35_KLT02893 [Carex littledalei]|uniref:Uncharacterized protein n=1 Tax=Carex littledalei TaxID=544730 RepID=A0A833R238_9POAL|nr:hypothetical protein FCM35_KLT02893 [Carex littledalei]